jgi:hypothetical protein
MAWAVLQQRQNQQLGTSLLQFAIGEWNRHMLLSHISTKRQVSKTSKDNVLERNCDAGAMDVRDVLLSRSFSER